MSDRQDKGADHYSDMIRNPARSVKVYNKLMWNERRQQININEIDRLRTRNINETRKAEKLYLEKLAELNEIKKLTSNQTNNKSLLSVAVKNKRVLSAKSVSDDNNNNNHEKPITIYEMHLVDSKKLFSKAKEFLSQIDNLTEFNINTNEYNTNEIVTNTFENINKLDEIKIKNKNFHNLQTPATTPIFSTEISHEEKKSRVINANKKYNSLNSSASAKSKNNKSDNKISKVQIQVLNNLIGEENLI